VYHKTHLPPPLMAARLRSRTMSVAKECEEIEVVGDGLDERMTPRQTLQEYLVVRDLQMGAVSTSNSTVQEEGEVCQPMGTWKSPFTKSVLSAAGDVCAMAPCAHHLSIEMPPQTVTHHKGARPYCRKNTVCTPTASKDKKFLEKGLHCEFSLGKNDDGSFIQQHVGEVDDPLGTQPPQMCDIDSSLSHPKYPAQSPSSKVWASSDFVPRPISLPRSGPFFHEEKKSKWQPLPKLKRTHSEIIVSLLL
jgi:hypothetical protein